MVEDKSDNGKSSWGGRSNDKPKDEKKKSGWESTGEDYELVGAPKPQTFTDEDCEAMLDPEKQLYYSSICLGAYGWDGTCKCISGDSLIIQESGIHPIAQSNEKQVAGINKDLKVQMLDCQVTETFRKETMQLTLQDGTELIATGDHPVLAQDGQMKWKKIMNLSQNDYVALIRSIKIAKPIVTNLNEARLIGYLIGDGGLSLDYNKTFTNVCDEIINECRHCVETIGVYLKLHSKITWALRPLPVIKKWLKSKGIKQCKSMYKELPNEVFSYDSMAVSELMSGLIETDGEVKSSQCSIVFNTSSKTLAKQVKILGLRFGAFATLITVSCQENPSYRVCWYGEMAKELGQRLRFVSPKKKEQLYKLLNQGIEHNPNIDVIPHYFLKNVELNTTWYNIGKNLGYKNPRDGYHLKRENTSRERLQKIADIDDNEMLRKLAQSDLIWVKVKSVEPNGQELVYNRHVPDEENFIANGIVTHNTGAVMDIYKNVVMPDGSVVANVLNAHEFTDYNDHTVSFPNGRKLVCYDADGSAGPIKTKYHGSHPNIIIIDPLVLSMKGMDYVGSFNKILAISQYVWKRQKELEIFAAALDGYDKVLKWMEYVMKYVDLKTNPNVRITDQFNWGYRNQKIDLISTILKKMACETYYTTHHKEKRKYEYDVAEKKKMLKMVGFAPDWIRTFPGMLFQKLEFTRDHNVEDRTVKFEVIIDKAKGALNLEGAKMTVAEVRNAEVKRVEGKVQVTGDWEWFGINDILNEFRRPVKVA